MRGVAPLNDTANRLQRGNNYSTASAGEKVRPSANKCVVDLMRRARRTPRHEIQLRAV
jgi:hypothetical protein